MPITINYNSEWVTVYGIWWLVCIYQCICKKMFLNSCGDHNVSEVYFNSSELID